MKLHSEAFHSCVTKRKKKERNYHVWDKLYKMLGWYYHCLTMLCIFL